MPRDRVTAAPFGTLHHHDLTDEREAVVYDHAARFAGLLDQPTVILEGFVRQKIRDGGPALDRAEERDQRSRGLRARSLEPAAIGRERRG